jgi:carboxyl-terminal processing protease
MTGAEYSERPRYHPSMHRERFAWSVSVVLVTLLAFQIPGTFAQRDDDYAFVRTLVDIHRQVATNYVEKVEEEKLRQGAIAGMLEQLDPYSVYVPPAREEEFNHLLEGSFKGVGIQLEKDKKTGEVIVLSPIEGSPAFKAGVFAGDAILKVNGEELDRTLKIEDIIKRIAGPIGSEVALTLRHQTGEMIDLKLTRQEIILPVLKGYSRKPDNTWDWYVVKDPKVAYIRLTQFTPDTAKKLREILEPLVSDGMKGLILDLRFNPGGRLDQAKEVVDLFVRNGTIVSVKGRNRPEDITYAKGAGTLPDFAMVVLVNEHSASASEIVAGSLLDNKRALVVGTRTYGKGSVQEVIPLDGKSGELKLTVAYYYLPSGRLVHRKKDATDWGVEPQVKVPMDDDTQRKVILAQAQEELLRAPGATQPSTRSATQPTSQPVDVQLEGAISAMTGHLVLQGGEQAARIRTAEKPATPAKAEEHEE